MTVFVECTKERRWYQIRRHDWADEGSFVIGSGVWWKVRCKRCDRLKTVYTPG